MDSSSSEEKKEETSTKLQDFIPIYIPGVERGLISKRNRKQRFLDFLKAKPAKNWFLKFRRKQNSTQTEADSSDQETTRRRRFRVPFVRKFKWQAVLAYSKKWIRNPMNVALFIWFIFVAVGIVILGLLMLGFLDSAIKNKDTRTKWTEIANQIVNALFTIMCLYQHPNLFHHLVLLCKWLPKNAVELRMTYCKVPSIKPHDRFHIGLVIILLHITCFAQYALCALYWGWTSDNRPDWATNTFIGVGIAAPVTAFLWTVFSPLGKKSEIEEVSVAESVTLGEAQTRRQVSVVLTEPEWVGGLFDCWDDVTVAYLSFFCNFCVFGWNMERLGFGNMYVHVATFVLFCVGPIVVFSVSVLKISDYTLKYVVGISGCVLCFCCFLYGGYWRIQMRKKFKLPGNRFCCGYPTVTDCFQWLFCWSCSLAQEVRTGNFYEGEEDEDGSFMMNLRADRRRAVEPLDREGTARSEMDRGGSSGDEFVSIEIGNGQVMRAPSPSLIDLNENERKS